MWVEGRIGLEDAVDGMEQLPHHRDIRLHFRLPPLQKPRIEGPDGLVVQGRVLGMERRSTSAEAGDSSVLTAVPGFLDASPVPLCWSISSNIEASENPGTAVRAEPS